MIDAIGGNAAVALEREARSRHQVAAGIIGEKGFRAVVGPFHRPADALARPQNGGLLGIKIVAKAETAADIGTDEANLLEWQSETFREHHARHVDALVSGNQRVGFRCRVVGGDARAWLHLGIGDPLIAKGLLDNEIGGIRRRAHRRGVAELLVKCNVVRRRRPDRLGAVHLAQIGHGLQHLVFDLDRLGGVPRLKRIFRHHNRDCFAWIAHAVDDQRKLRLLQHRAFLRREGAHLDVDRVGWVGALHRAFHPIRHVIGSGQDRNYARHRSRSRCVDPLHDGVGVRRAHERGNRLVRHRDVVGIPPRAAHQPQILEARHRPSDIRSAWGFRFSFHSACRIL